jgi:molybdopterin/thiamine biosynthesis adenylyltransferase
MREIHAKPSRATDTMRRLDRNARMPEFVDVECDFGAAMRGQYVAQIGCGSVALPVSDNLARIGVGRLLVVDPARLKPTSVLTHPCWPDDLGRPKAIVAGERAKAVSPDTQVFVFDGAFEELPTHVLAEASYLLLASDNLRCEASVSQSALHLGIPVLQGSVYGPTLSAQVRSIASSDGGDGPCLCCSFGEREWEDLDRGTRFSCTGADASRGAAAEHTRIPTASLAHLCSTAGNLLCTEHTRRTLDLGDAEESRLIEYCGYTHRTTVTPLRRNPKCTMDHARYRLEPRARDLGRNTPRELLRQAGYEGADPCRVTMTVEGFCFATLALCGCNVHPTLGRFVPAGSTAGACLHCGWPRRPHPIHTYKEVPMQAMAGGFDRTLEWLGALAPTSARVRGESGSVLFHRRFAQGGDQR